MNSTTWGSGNQLTSGTFGGTNFGNNQLDEEWDNLFDGDDENSDENGGQYAHGNNYNKTPYQNPYSYRDCIVFLIDASKSMFEKNDSGEIPFHNALKCLIQTITDKIITSESDLIGICFYNTEKKKNINDFDNIYVLSELDIPDPKVILQLEDILENDFTNSYGHFNGDFPLCDALWTCSTMFSNMKQTSTQQQNNFKRIFLFTNQDNPNQYNDGIKNLTIQRAKDLSELGIQIELFSMDKPGEKFDFTLFYQNILVFGDDDQYIDPNQFNASTKFSELLSKLKRKEFKKRSLGKIPLYIGNVNNNNNNSNNNSNNNNNNNDNDNSNQNQSIVISTQLYNLFSTARKSSPVLLDPKTNLPVKQLIKNVCDATGSTLLPSQIKQSFYYGGEPVIFSKDELDSIKSIDRIGLTLLGFKPTSAIKPYHSIKHASFIFPDEQLIKGSSVVFNALIEQMLKSDKVAICRFTARSGSAPRMVALLPQDEILINEYDSFTNPSQSQSSQPSQSQSSQSSQSQSTITNLKGKIQFRPRGMHIIYLPYADDIRHPVNVGVVKKKKSDQNKEQQSIELAKKIIKSMKIKFDEKKYLNPSLQKHYASLQALALERDTIEETVDNIQPDRALIEKNLDLCREFSDSIFPPGYAQTVSNASTQKRSRDGKDLSALDWVDMLKTGEISKLTVDDLKSFMNNQGIKFSSKSKKADLITLISKFILDGNIDNNKLLLLKKDESMADNNSTNADTGADEEENKRPKKKLRSKSPSKSKDCDNDNSSDNENEERKRKKSSKSTTTSTTTTTSTSTLASSKSTTSKNNKNNNNDEFDIDFKNSDDEDTDNEILTSSPTNAPSTTHSNNTQSSSSSSQSNKKKGNYRSDDTFDTRPLCKYDPDCFRINPQHNSEFRHTNK